MADRVRKPEWLKINIGANERYTETKKLIAAPPPCAATGVAGWGVAPIWGNAGERELPHL